MTVDRACERCGRELAGMRVDARYCGVRCRQAANREASRRSGGVAEAPPAGDVSRETDPPADPVAAQHWDPRLWTPLEGRGWPWG